MTANAVGRAGMLYQAYQAHSDIMVPVRAWAGMAVAAAGKSFAGVSDNRVLRNLTAAYELIARAGLTHERPPFGIDTVKVGNREVAVHEERALVTPFGTLLHFRKDIDAAQPRVLLVAPLSGHFATLLRSTVATMLTEHDVYITDWHNVRDVSPAHGDFGFDDYAGHLIQFLEAIGPGAHVVAVCQPCVSVLVAAAVMAQTGNAAQPRSMSLMAGPIDTRVNPTKVNALANSRPIDWFEKHLIATVPLRYGGASRRVYPGFVQLAAFMSMNIERHIKAHRELYDNLANGEIEKAEATKSFYDEYFAVLDLTAGILSRNRANGVPGARAAARALSSGAAIRSSRAHQAHDAAHRGGRARRHLRRRPDLGRPRPVLGLAALSQAPSHAGGRRALRRVQRPAVGDAGLSDPEERHPVERLTGEYATVARAAMLPPSTVVTSAVVLSASACARNACATSSAVTSRLSRLPDM